MHPSRGKAQLSKLQKERGPPLLSLINNEINKLRARLKKLAARNTEAATSTLTLPFNAEIQQAPLFARFRMPTMATYKGKTDPQDHLNVFID